MNIFEVKKTHLFRVSSINFLHPGLKLSGGTRIPGDRQQHYSQVTEYEQLLDSS